MQQNKVGEVKLFKVFGHFSILFFTFATSVHGVSFENFKRTQADSFQAFQNKDDDEFSKYLKSEWQAYGVEEPIKRYKGLKPRALPSTISTRIKSVGPTMMVKVKGIDKVKQSVEEVNQSIENNISQVVINGLPINIIVVEEPEKEPEKIPKNTLEDISFDFYGTTLYFHIPAGVQKANFYPLNQTGISNFFTSVAMSEYNPLIEDIDDIRKTMNLNDWGTYLLILRVSDAIFSNQDDSKLLSWFLFNKLGFSVKVGLNGKHVELIFYSKKMIYATPYYMFGKNKFYVLSQYAKNGLNQLYTYEQNYPEANKELDLSLVTLPNLALNMKNKTLSFNEYSQEYSVAFEYNQNLLDFMATYPQADYETFFNAPVDFTTYESVATALKQYIDGMKASDAINFILHFVQNAFRYQTDDEQFNREKVMFAQETLYFEESDCEDRAILFAYLVKRLLNISVEGVKYKDHMATALAIPLEGDSVEDGFKRLLIADPTYIHANIGQSMPKYKSKRPESFIQVK